MNVDRGDGFERLSKRKGTSATLHQLRMLAEACVRLDPKNAVAHYRLGALFILTDNKNGALESFMKAGTLEKESFQVHEIGARVAAEVTDSRLRRNKEIALAVWAAHAACAINTGSEYATKEIWEMVEEKLPKQLLYDFPGKPEPLAIATIREMLSSPT